LFWRSARRGIVKFCPNPLISIPRAPAGTFRCSLFEEGFFVLDLSRKIQAASFSSSVKIAEPIPDVETTSVPSDLISAVRRPLASVAEIA
jgi:hypothetical protein